MRCDRLFETDVLSNFMWPSRRSSTSWVQVRRAVSGGLLARHRDNGAARRDLERFPCTNHEYTAPVDRMPVQEYAERLDLTRRIRQRSPRDQSGPPPVRAPVSRQGWPRLSWAVSVTTIPR